MPDRSKCIDQILEPGRLLDGCIPAARLDCRGRDIAQAFPIPDPWDKWFIPKFSCREQCGRLTPERVQELHIGSILWQKDREALLGMLSNREYALSWTWEELAIISDEVEPPQGLQWLCIPHTEESYSYGNWDDLRDGLAGPIWACLGPSMECSLLGSKEEWEVLHHHLCSERESTDSRRYQDNAWRWLIFRSVGRGAQFPTDRHSPDVCPQNVAQGGTGLSGLRDSPRHVLADQTSTGSY